MNALDPLDATCRTPIWPLGGLPAEHGPCVATIGVFDGIHRGHGRLIGRTVELARQRRRPAVLITFDPHPALVVGPPRDVAALTTLEQRADLAGLLGVDGLCVLPFTREFARLTPSEFVDRVLLGELRAEAVVVGANFTFGHKGIGDVDALRSLGQSHGLAVESVPLLQTTDQPCSSTRIRGLIRSGDLAAAAQALGRPYEVAGRLEPAPTPARSVTAFFRPATDVALPPPGRYNCRLDDGTATAARIDRAGVVALQTRLQQPSPATLRFVP